MEVKLISYSQPVNPDGDRNPLSIAELAASVCYDSEPTDSYRIVKGCKATGHRSVLEHISFTFEVSSVSRALLAQLSRHRHISLSVQSQRYVSMDNFDYINPFDVQHGGDVFDDMMSNIANDYKLLKNLGAANEDARAVLPNACCTKLYVTINARSLIEMSHLRLCTRAQNEIRSMFQLIKSQVAAVCPELAAWMAPSCEANPKYPFCPEGNRCCGRHPKLADVYKPIEKNKEAIDGNT